MADLLLEVDLTVVPEAPVVAAGPAEVDPEARKRLQFERDKLMAVIGDSYRRMASNETPHYRVYQLGKCVGWLEQLEELYRQDPIGFMS